MMYQILSNDRVIRVGFDSYEQAENKVTELKNQFPKSVFSIFPMV